MGHDKFLEKNWMPSMGFSRKDNESYVKFANSLGVAKVGVDGRGVFAQLAGSEKFYISSLAVEDTNRTIYVETTGNDTTGDGSATNPYLTINRAIGDIKRTISDCIITIQLGPGTFNFTADDRDLISLIDEINNGSIAIQGVSTKIKDGYTLGQTHADVLRYDVTDVGFTWTENQYRDKFLTDGGGSNFHPISYNEGGTDSGFVLDACKHGLTSYDEIHELSTTIHNVDGIADLLEFDNNWGKIKFSLIKFTTTGDGFTWEHARTFVFFEACVFDMASATSAPIRIEAIRSTPICPIIDISSCVIIAGSTEAVRIRGTYRDQYLSSTSVRGSHSQPILFSDATIQLTDLVIDASSATTAAIGCIVNARISIARRLKFYSCPRCIRFKDAVKLTGNNLSQLVVDDCDYMFYDEVNDGVEIYIANSTVGTLNNELFVSGENQFINPKSGTVINIPDIYSEYASKSNIALTNNAATDVVVGSKTQNASIFIKYSIKRDDEVESNTAIISNNGTSVSISEGTPVGDDAGISPLAVAYNGDDIELTFTLDDDVAGELKYTIERTML